MTENDVAQVTEALNTHLSENYKVHIVFNEDEVRHFLLPRDGVVFSWLVMNDEGKVSDFISFYALNSQILNDPNNAKIHAAYAFYNFVKDSDVERMKMLMKDSLIFAKQSNYDVFNMVNVCKHSQI